MPVESLVRRPLCQFDGRRRRQLVDVTSHVACDHGTAIWLVTFTANIA
jgi:hypothetical protein